MEATKNEPQIVLQEVEVRYSEFVYGLRDVSLTINSGDFVFFVGQTGSGKSTLLKLLTKEARPTAGNVFLWGVDVEEIPDKQIPDLRRSMGIVPQDFALLPRKQVFENVAYAMRALGATKREVRKRVPEILDLVNMGHRVDAFPDQLSGGEKQRVAIGRALINRPHLLIADEPTGNLDPEHSWGIMDILRELNRRGTTVLVASHDMMIVEKMGKRIVTLQGGRVASDYTPSLLPFGAEESSTSPQPELEDAIEFSDTGLRPLDEAPRRQDEAPRCQDEAPRRQVEVIMPPERVPEPPSSPKSEVSDA